MVCAVDESDVGMAQVPGGRQPSESAADYDHAFSNHRIECGNEVIRNLWGEGKLVNH